MKKLSVMFYEDATRYFNAAEVLSGSEQRDEDDQLFLTPILFLLRHSIELNIKAKIFQFLENTFSEGDLLEFKIILENGQVCKKKTIESHSIQNLFSCLRYLDKSERLVSIFDDDELSFSLKIVKEIESIDSQSDYFRYPISKNNQQHKRKFLSLSENEVASDIRNGKFLFLLESTDHKVIHFSTLEEKYIVLVENMRKFSYILLNKF